MLPDINDSDDPRAYPELRDDMLHHDQLRAIADQIENQYKDFESLGENLIKEYEHQNMISDDDKLILYNDMISYVNDHIISIGDIGNFAGDPERILGNGEFLYQFICVDQVTTLIPALMETLKVTSIDDFDKLINTKYASDVNRFKTDYAHVVNLTIKQLEKLQAINPQVVDDKNYIDLLSKYFYYQELIDFGDMEMFLNSFIRPVISKYEASLVWKLL